METDNKQTIDDIVKLLEEIKAKHGNLYVSEIFYGSEDYPKIEVIPIKPCVILILYIKINILSYLIFD